MTISGKRKTNHKTQETSIMSQSVVDAYSMDILSEREVYGSYHLLQPRKSRFLITVMLQILVKNTILVNIALERGVVPLE